MINRRTFLSRVASAVGISIIGGGAGEMMLENDFVRYTIDASGRSIGFVDKRTGRDYCAKDPPQPFATIRKDGKNFEPSRCSYTNGRLVFSFPKANITVTVRAMEKRTHFAFEVESIEGGNVEEIVFGAIRVGMARHVNRISGIVSDGDFACCIRTQDFRVGFLLVDDAKPLMGAICLPKYQVTGAKAVLVGCPFGMLRSILQEVVREEGMLYSPVGGPFALDAEETRGSYVFATVSEANVGEWIRLCKKAGIDMIHMIGWDRSFGHYEPREDLFPNGLKGLRDTIARIHDAGLRAGLHVHFGVSPHDPYATPIPDRRLKTDASFILSDPLDERSEFVTTTSPPEDLDVIWAFASRGNVLRIGDELIQYRGLSKDPPGFAGCRRGAFGTKPSSHEKGERVEHMYVRYCQFFPDEDSTLVDEIGERVSEIVNSCGVDMVYMDGAEGMPGNWYGVSKMRAAIFKGFKGRVMVEASEWGYHSWAFHSRIGAWDHPNWGLKRFVDLHCKANEEYRKGSLLPAQLGWWAILGPSEHTYAELPDEVEYLCCKALAYDMPISFQGIGLGEPWNARQDEYLEMIGRYERLRLSRYFPEKIKERLRMEGEEFRLFLSAEDGSWKFVPTDYLVHKVIGLEDGRNIWTFHNRFGNQPLKIRIQALYAAAPYDGPEGLLITNFQEGGWEEEGSEGTRCSLFPSDGPVESKGIGGFYRARNGSDKRQGAWTRIVKRFSPPLDLSKYGALGFFLYGDGKGELLNFQLTNPPQYWTTYDEHYIVVDFTGWRYFELHLKERDADRYGDYRWPYDDLYAIYRNPLIRHSVSALTIYYNNLPPKEEVGCYISPIKALPERKAGLANPTVNVNGSEIVFPVVLESGQYMEFLSPSECRIYDERGRCIGKAFPKGDVPEVLSGDNRIAFSCEKQDGYNIRAVVTIVLEGSPI
jgi:hypothetical protein